MKEISMHEKGVVKVSHEVRHKPWGSEVIWASNPKYVGKILRIGAGQRTSLQYHTLKHETITLLDGEALYMDEIMSKGVSYSIARGVIHRITAVTDCQLLEVSTPEEGGTIRMEDDYRRSNELL